MRKFLGGLLVGLVLMLAVTAFSAGIIEDAKFSDEIQLRWDGKKVETEILTVSLKGEKDSRNYVNLQDLVSALGGKVQWNDKNKVIEVTTQKANFVKVVRVIDGDTFEIEGGKKVRLIGVDTPESVHPDAARNTEFGKKAAEFTKKTIEGKKVLLFKDVSETDKYGRLLRYVYLEDGTFFNELLVREGYAMVSTYPPDVKFADLFLEAQQYARENNKGLWAYEDEAKENGSQDSSNINDPDKKEYMYVGSKNSDKFHYPSCYHVNTILEKNLVTFKNRDEAVKAGYKPCSVCTP